MSSRRAGVIATLTALVLVSLSGPTRLAHGNCGIPRRIHLVQNGTMTANVFYHSWNGKYDVTITNNTAAWYFLRESYPEGSTAACWPAGMERQRNRPLPTTRLPEVIGPFQTISLGEMELQLGDRFGICHVGLVDADGSFSAESQWVAAITSLDLIGLGIFGESIGTDIVADPDPIAVLHTLSAVASETDYPSVSMVLDLLALLADPHPSFWDVASALDANLEFSIATVGRKAKLIESLRALGISHPFQVLSDTIEGIRDANFVARIFTKFRNAYRMFEYFWGVYDAYRVAPWGFSGIEVVVAPPNGESLPAGNIQRPVQGQIVGNTVMVTGVASSECRAIHHVNLTYSLDNGVTWHYFGQDQSAPYEFSVNLASVPDGTTVRFGWDVYDSEGVYANSPNGHRVVVKNAAALAPPPYDAQFVADVAPYTDGAVLAPGQSFTKGWRVRNSGSAAWGAGFSLNYVSGVNLAAVTSVPLPALAAGQIGTIEVPMTAPATPHVYRSTWRLQTPAGVQFGSSVFALIEVRAEAPGSGMCDASDRCVNMGCSTHAAPPDGTRFKTPGTGSGVFYARAGYKHSYPTSACYHLFYDDFSNLSCIANGNAAPPELSDGPSACTEGSFYREDGSPAIYRMESGHLRPLCGAWTSNTFFARWGFPFQIAFLVDAAHFDDLTEAYPILVGDGIYPPGAQAPQCGQPGLECGNHIDPEGVCYGTLYCGGCGAGAQCLAGMCVAEPLAVGAGAFTAPADGATLPSGGATITWTHGASSDGSAVRSALFCSVDGGPWEVRVGFATSTTAVIAFDPGASVQCKLRTRLESAWDEWTESSPVSWSVSSDSAAMTVVAIVETAASRPNGCGDLQVEARIRNDGALTGSWEATAYLHPVLEDETSPQAIASRQVRTVTLAPGAEATYAFAIPTPAPLPPGALGWSVTVVVTDPHALAPPTRGSSDVSGHDTGGPQFDVFQIYGFTGSPVELVPGRAHMIQVAGHDDYALDTWDLAWRADGAWIPITAGAAYTNGCRERFGTWYAWTVPTGLLAGTAIEVRARYRDLAGNLTEQIRPARLRSSAAPSVTFLRPLTGEQHVASTADAPHCVTVEAIVVPGVPIQQVTGGFTRASHSPLESPTVVAVPTDGHVVTCLPAWNAGDQVEIYLRVRDTNGTEFTFFAGPITVEFPAPPAPWGPIRLEATQAPPQPAPVLGGQSYMDYTALAADATTLIVYRRDYARWEDSSTFEWRERHALRRLSFARADLAPLSSTAVVDSFTEVDPSPAAAGSPVEVSPYDGWSYFLDVAPLAGCHPSSETCAYEPRVREIAAGGPGLWRSLGSFTGRAWFEAPFFDYASGSLPLPGGGRMISIYDPVPGATTLWRSSGSTWSSIATLTPGLHDIAVAHGTLWGFRRSDDGAGNARVAVVSVDPQTGATSAPIYLVAGTAVGYSWRIARDPVDDTIVLASLDVAGNRLNVAHLQGSSWVESPAQVVATSWRDHLLTFRTLAQLQATAGHVRAVLNVAWAGGGSQLSVVFHPGDPVDLPHALAHDGAGPIALAADGRLIKTFVCRWNFEDRLCVQVGYPVTTDCWDGNACTDEVWDPLAGSCSVLRRVCPSDGDACNGPEVCDPATGACVTDAASAPICGDGAWCNGAELCVPTTGACVPSAAPLIDDYRSCTVDSCDESSDVVRHIPDDTRCPAHHCEVATCAPGEPGADSAGCVRTAVVVSADTLTCTDDACDPATGETVHAIRAGFCVIDGVCYAAGARDVGGCRACAPAVRTTGWTPVADGGSCDDERYCTIGDVCIAGACVGATRSCGLAPLPCLAVTCDEVDDECELVVRPDGAACDDGNACNGAATCNAGTCIQGPPIAVDDGRSCTDDLCDPFLGTLHPDNTASCNADNNGCTADDVCAGGTCVTGPTVDCGSVDDQCNVGRCASTGPDSHACVRDPGPREGQGCDDGNLCSFGEQCTAGACVVSTHVQCPEADECHQRGTCDPASGACSDPVPLDGTPCTGGMCVAGSCVPELDAGLHDGGDDAADAGLDSGSGDDAAPPDASPPDAGDDPSVDGCECDAGRSHGAQPILAGLVLIAITRRRRLGRLHERTDS